MKTQIINIVLLTIVALSCNSPQNTKMDEPEKSITETHWKLSTIEGKDIKNVDQQEQEIHFILKEEGRTISGFAGCNSFTGTYTLEEENRIRFSQMAPTMKSCPEVDINEQDFL